MNFASTINRGFQMKFENDVEISVQWGAGNYCSNRDITKGYLDSMDIHVYEADTAEVLITRNEKNISQEFAEIVDASCDGTVIGWVSSDKVAEAITWAKNYK